MLSPVLQEAFTSLQDVLMWIVIGGGAMWIFGILEARILENLVWWHNFPIWVKKIVPGVIAGLIGIGAQVLIDVDIVQFIPEWAQAMLLVAVNWIFSQREYSSIKDTSYGSSTRLMAANLD